MSDTTDKTVRLIKVARELNIGVHDIVEFLGRKGHRVDANPNTKISGELYAMVQAELRPNEKINDWIREEVVLGFLDKIKEDLSISIYVDPGTAPPEEIALLLHEFSVLYRMIGGSGITFTLDKVLDPIYETAE